MLQRPPMLEISPHTPRPGLRSPRARALLSALLVTAALLALFPLRRWAQHIHLKLTAEPSLDIEIAYQVIALMLTGAAVWAVRALGARWRLLARGNLSTPAQPIKLLGIKEGEPWRVVVRNFVLIATPLTTAVVFLQLPAPGGLALATLLPSILWALPFAASNAAVEEGLLRLALLEGTADAMNARQAALLSGALFGAVHFFGVPGGIAGVAMAGILGYVLARLVVETRGILWAWFIHFALDIAIFTLTFASRGEV